ncbi:MAG: hypothetical protein ACE14O_03435 [Candidatus Cloacimonadaceae bacterium]
MFKTENNLPFDYMYLLDRLKNYARPRDKITQLLRKGEIIRIRKGLYITPETANPYLKEILAGMIYGPSYISLEYALAHYQMIPEQIKVITSVTTGKPNLYTTPVGVFTYRHLKKELYPLGVEYFASGNGGFFMASREKALCDLIYYHTAAVKNEGADVFLLEDMRFDPFELAKIKIRVLTKWQKIYRLSALEMVINFLRGLKK